MVLLGVGDILSPLIIDEMSLILREGPSFYDFQVFEAPPFCFPCKLSFWFYFFLFAYFLNFIFTISFRLCYLFQSVYPFAHSVHSSSPYPER